MESFIFLFCAFRVPPWKRSLSTSTRNARQNTKSAQRGEVSLCIDAIVGSTTPGRAKDLLSCEP